MVGTIDEILFHIALKTENANALCMSRQRLVHLRCHIPELSEDTKRMYLNRYQNSVGHYGKLRCLREDKIIPAVVRDKHGKFFTEQTLLLMVEREEKMNGLHLNRVCEHIRLGQLPNENIVREVLRRKGWTMFQERTYLPSIWELE